MLWLLPVYFVAVGLLLQKALAFAGIPPLPGPDMIFLSIGLAGGIVASIDCISDLLAWLNHNTLALRRVSLARTTP